MTLLEVRDVRTGFDTDRGILRAVDGVSFRLDRGETLGLVGESGSGKSVLIRSLVGFDLGGNVAYQTGESVFDGTDLLALPPKRRRAYWGRNVGFVFQNPMSSLNPVVRIGRQITEVLGRHFGLRGSEARKRAAELLRMVEISDPERRLRNYPHELSGGMRQRVTIAIALAAEPELLVADEPTTALDVTVQAQILALLRRLQQERNMALIMVSHNLAVVAGLADRIAVMYAGRFVELGPADEVVRNVRMPYTEALLACNPRLDAPSHQLLAAIPGRPPNLIDPMPGCPFEPRCGYAQPRCAEEEPALSTEPGGHAFACWYPVGGKDRVTEQAR